jgi:hypothetical protein
MRWEAWAAWKPFFTALGLMEGWLPATIGFENGSRNTVRSGDGTDND